MPGSIAHEGGISAHGEPVPNVRFCRIARGRHAGSSRLPHASRQPSSFSFILGSVTGPLLDRCRYVGARQAERRFAEAGAAKSKS
jgi:hypothetical protein